MSHVSHILVSQWPAPPFSPSSGVRNGKCFPCINIRRRSFTVVLSAWLSLWHPGHPLAVLCPSADKSVPSGVETPALSLRHDPPPCGFSWPLLCSWHSAHFRLPRLLYQSTDFHSFLVRHCPYVPSEFRRWWHLLASALPVILYHQSASSNGQSSSSLLDLKIQLNYYFYIFRFN